MLRDFIEIESCNFKQVVVRTSHRSHGFWNSCLAKILSSAFSLEVNDNEFEVHLENGSSQSGWKNSITKSRRV